MMTIITWCLYMPGGQATQKESLASQPGAHCIKTIDIAKVKVFHLANSCSLFHRAAVWDELGDLPVHPVLGTDVAGRSGGKLLVEHVASLAHRAALQAVSPGDAGHLNNTGTVREL